MLRRKNPVEWDPDFIGHLLEWLAYDGTAFFQMCLDEYSELAPVWRAPGAPIPYPVHFREGMQVRNAMRRIHKHMGFDVYGAKFYDDYWQSAVEAALKMCEEGYNSEHRFTDD